MAAVVLWGRVEQVGSSDFLAIATAYSPAEPDSTLVRHTIWVSRLAAEAALKDSLTSLGETVREAGHTIEDVETDGV